MTSNLWDALKAVFNRTLQLPMDILEKKKSRRKWKKYKKI